MNPKSDSGSDNAFDVPPTSKANKGRPKKSKDSTTEDDDKPAKKPPKPKHLVHIHTNGAQLEDTFVSQIPDGEPSSSPWRIRGARWQKPPKPPPQPQLSPPKTSAAGARTVLGNRTSNSPAAAVQNKTPMALQGLQKGQLREETISRSSSASPPSQPGQHGQQQTIEYDFEKELADLPSDAFASSSSSPQKSPVRNDQSAILISSQPGVSAPTRRHQPPNLAAPRQGLQQLTLFGQSANNAGRPAEGDAQKKKVHNWPMAQRDEPPTHHKLDTEAMKTYVYPTNLGKIRDYQFSIVKRGLFHNLLVALPTGLGKTFIAATIMLNWYRWTKDAQIVFVAPTKPLVSQQVDACFGIAGIPRSQTSMLTGGISPGLRAEEWTNKRVFFMTPQTIINDLKTGICDPKRLVLLVVDEAHRATGNYAYVEVVRFLRRFNQSFRVLALTATPGGTVESVQDVINGLGISRVEIRTEFSLDIREYVFQRRTETFTFDPSDEMELVMDLFSKTLSPMLNQLRQQNGYWTADPMRLTAYGLNQARQKWMQSAGKNANPGLKGMVNRIFAVLASLAHSIELLIYHGISPFYHNMVQFRDSLELIKGGKYEKQVAESEHFMKMMTLIGAWVRNDTFVGHPKLEHLQEVVLNHFMDAGEGREVAEGQPPSATRVMIFCHYRDSAEDVARVLRRNSPMIRPHVFVGQAASKDSEGMNQKKQLEVIHDFKSGKFNTLVATSIGEEGLDIGEIDLIICYDSSASPIRMLQRMGRTGRKRAGNIILLLMKGKEENSFVQAKDSYEKMQKLIADGNRFEFHEETARRIVPKGIEPVVNKRVVEIPPENTQGDLPEPKKRKGRAPKRPPKKFHMPDGVQTGFVKVSRMQGRAGDSEDEQPVRRKRRPAKVAEELEPIPSLDEVLLTAEQERELFRRYQDMPVTDEADLTVKMPDLNTHPEQQRRLAPTHLVKHGRATTNLVRSLTMMHSTNHERVSTLMRHRNVDLDEFADDTPDLVSDIDSDEERPLPKPKGKTSVKPAAKHATKTSVFKKPGAPASKPVAAAKPKAQAPKPASKKASAAKPAAGVKKAAKGRRQAVTDDALDAVEGRSSSPPPTDPRYAMATQGIDLGSDTSGDDMEEGEPSSDLRDFIADDEDDAGNAASGSNDDLDDDDDDDLTIFGNEPQVDQSEEDDRDEAEDLPSLNTIMMSTAKGPSKQAPAKRKRTVIEDSSD